MPAVNGLDLRVLGLIDDRTHKTVFGFLHEIEKLLTNNVIIPNEIADICLLFVFSNASFQANLHGTEIEISGNGKIASIHTTKSHWQCAFISTIISGGKSADSIFEWIFKINASVCSSTIAQIGILSVNNSVYNDNVFNSNPFIHAIPNCNYYALYFVHDDGFRSCIKDSHDESQKALNSISGWECMGATENTIKIQIDTLATTIRYVFNDKDYGIAFENIDWSKKYQMVICLYDDRSSLQIKCLKITHMQS